LTEIVPLKQFLAHLRKNRERERMKNLRNMEMRISVQTPTPFLLSVLKRSIAVKILMIHSYHINLPE